MTSHLTPLLAAEDVSAIAGHIGFLAEAQPARLHGVRAGSHLHRGFARDFATADGERVLVAVLSSRQFADLAKTARLARTFAFLERLLHADFSACGDLYTHRAAIAVLLAPWFARRTVADLATAFAGTSVPWARVQNLSKPDHDLDRRGKSPAGGGGLPSDGRDHGLECDRHRHLGLRYPGSAATP